MTDLDASVIVFVDAAATFGKRERHTLKRVLTAPRMFSESGNAYSDEILRRARLSPFELTDRLTDDETHRLFEATRTTLREWTARLRAEVGDGFPTMVTAFRKGLAAHAGAARAPTSGQGRRALIRRPDR
jgi:formamidopyrimidine-DNA glycosylase